MLLHLSWLSAGSGPDPLHEELSEPVRHFPQNLAIQCIAMAAACWFRLGLYEVLYRFVDAVV